MMSGLSEVRPAMRRAGMMRPVDILRYNSVTLTTSAKPPPSNILSKPTLAKLSSRVFVIMVKINEIKK